MESFLNFMIDSVTAFCMVSSVMMLLYHMLQLPEAKPAIAKYALRELSLLGRYDNRLSISIRYWVFAIEVYCYKQDPTFDVHSVILNWNAEHNHDSDGIIFTGIDEAHTMLLETISKAREEHVEPVFKVSPEYDYHVYPKSMIHNDYIDPDSLLVIIDSLIGGKT